MRRLVPFAGLVGLVGCSDRSVGLPDGAAIDQWTPCPSTLQGASGQPCVGANRCDYGGCALPGDWCYCEEGKWQCVMSACPGPDIGPDATHLGQGDPCDPADDRCEPGLKCCLTGGGPSWIVDAAPPQPFTCIPVPGNSDCPPPSP